MDTLLRVLGLDIFNRSHTTSTKVAVSFVVKTLLPIVATTTMVWAWRSGGGWGFMWLLGVLVLAVVWLRLTVIELDAGSPDRVMALRRSLAAVRELVQHRIDAIGRSSPTDALAALKEIHNGPVVLSEIMAGIFYVVSAGNSDLNRHIRVTLMEPDEDRLRITFYRNTDNQMPQSMANGLTLARGAGVAGKAWELGETMVVPDVESDLSAASPLFVPLTRAHSKFKIRSIVSVPVFHRSAAGERLLAVLNIDCDQANHFTTQVAALTDFEILLRPFLRMIEMAIVATEQNVRLEAASDGLAALPRRPRTAQQQN